MGKNMDPKLCKHCRKPMEPLISLNRPQSSEWYCKTDCISEKMSADEFEYLAPLYQQEMARRAGK